MGMWEKWKLMCAACWCFLNMRNEFSRIFECAIPAAAGI